MLGHVNNAVFLNWLEQARLEIFEEIGWSLEALIGRRWVSNVVRIEIDYRREVRFGDEIELATWLERIGTSSITLAHRLSRDGSEVVAEARVVVVWLGADGRPSPVPEELRAELERGDA